MLGEQHRVKIVEDDQAELEEGVKGVISLLSSHKKSKSSPPWISLTLIYHQFALTVVNSDSSREY